MSLPSKPPGQAAGPGIALVVAGYLVSSISDTAVKWVSGSYPVPEMLFFAALFSLIPMAVATMACGGLAALVTRRPGVQFGRAGLGLTGYLCGFYAIGHMPLADFYALVFTSPLFITALSALVAREAVDRPRWLAVAAGFAGILVMLRPGSGLAGFGALAGLGGSVCYALSVLLVRRFGGSERPVTFGTYGALVMAGGAGLLLPSGVTVPDGHDLVLLAVGGIGMGTALLCIFAAFRRTPAAVLAPFQYTQMIWGVLAGLLLFGEQPDIAVAVGAVLVVGSGLYILHRETRPVLARS